MACAGRDELPEQEIAPGLQQPLRGLGRDDGRIRVRTGRHGRVDDARGAPRPAVARRRTGAMLLSGRILVDYGDRQEEIVGGQAYYVEPGHRISFLEDSEAVEFTPTDELEKTLEVVRRNAAAAADAAS